VKVISLATVKTPEDAPEAPPPPEERLRVRVHHFVRTPLAAIAVVEGLALLLAPFAARAVFALPVAGVAVLAGACAFAGLVLLSLLSMGLYSRRQRARLSGIMLRVMAALGMGSLLFGFLSYLVPELALRPRVMLLAIAIAFLALLAIRYASESLVDEAIFKRRVLVYGAGRRATSVAQLRRRHDRRGFAVVGYVPTPGDRLVIDGDRLLEPGGPLLRYCRDHQIDEIVVAMDDRRREFPVHELLECRLAGIAVTDLVDFLETETGKVRLDVLNPSWMIFAEGFRRGPIDEIASRLLDICASLAILAVTWPFMLLTYLAIKLEEGPSAPTIYSQVRVGQYGRPFHVLKFRSMRVDAEAGGAMWAQRRDPRVTRVGGFIRKTRVDELPQLVNVLRGEMSFVGPRPERPEFVSRFELRVPYYRERHCVKPGITGWAQLCYPYGAGEDDAVEKLQYDLYYIKNRSLLFDLMILLQTAEVVLWGKGAR
jgi:sugar transferase (PEP-CTERM system associated)